MAEDERRKDPRIPLRSQAEVRFTSWDVFSLIYTINISRGGMNLELSTEPAIGDVLVVKIQLPLGPPIELEAVVRHVTPMVKPKPADATPPAPGAKPPTSRCQVGVEFANLDDKKRAAIEATIKARGAAPHA